MNLLLMINYQSLAPQSVMQQVFKNIAKITKTNYTVLITGESGSGKELVAKVIHDYSPRSAIHL